jgi:hypothetical protein
MTSPRLAAAGADIERRDREGWFPARHGSGDFGIIAGRDGREVARCHTEADRDALLKMGQAHEGLNAFAALVARLLLDGEAQDDGEGGLEALQQSDDDAQDTLRSLITKARALTGIEGPGKPVCENFQSDGRGCCRHCDHFHGPDGAA